MVNCFLAYVIHASILVAPNGLIVVPTVSIFVFCLLESIIIL